MCQITCHLICSKFDPRLFQTTKNCIQTTPLKFWKYNTEFREYLSFIPSMSFLNICLRRKSYSFAQDEACHAMQLFKLAEDWGYCSILPAINIPYAENSLGLSLQVWNGLPGPWSASQNFTSSMLTSADFFYHNLSIFHSTIGIHEKKNIPWEICPLLAK